MERISLIGLDVLDKVEKKGSLNPEIGPQVEALLLAKLAVCAQYGRRYDEALALCDAAQQKSDPRAGMERFPNDKQGERVASSARGRRPWAGG